MQRGGIVVDQSNSSEDQATPNQPNTEEPLSPEPQPISPAQTSDPHVSEPNPNASTDPLAPMAPAHQGKSHKKLWIITTVALLLIAIGAAVFFVTKPDNNKQSAAVVVKKTNVQKSATSPELVTTIKYLDTPKDLGDLKWFSNLGEMFGYECKDGETSDCKTPMVSASDITYMQIGTTKDGKPVIVAYYIMGEASFAYYAVETSPDNYTVLGRLSGITNSNDKQYVAGRVADFKKNVNSDLSLDETTLPDEYIFPDTISFKGMNFVGTYNEVTPSGNFIRSLADIRGYFFNKPVSDKDITVIGTDKSHTYYIVTASDQPLYKIQEMYGTVDDYYAKAYKVDGTIASDKTATITWDDGTKNTAVYMGRNIGCGTANGYLVAKNLSDSDLTAVGKTATGDTVYKLSNDNPLLQKEYTEDYAKGADLDTASLKNLSIEGFQKVHGLVIVKNGLGEYAVYLNSSLFQGGGCAKPVIYLYPTEPQMVNVKVAADVKVSNPYYPVGGWHDVFALPDSRLLYQGKGYDSLFWEGQGYGVYPTVRAGTVVPSSQAVATIRLQLTQQGFNSKEINDFMAYWQPKLPSAPYTRLTWFNTQQMNELAPLSIFPRPQTLIRTFLEFQGLDQPISLAPQHFTAPARNGFTVTEWGGLLRQ